MSWLIRKMQIKTIMECHFTPTSMAKIKKTDSDTCRWGPGVTGILVRCWWECALVQSLWKNVYQFLMKLNIVSQQLHLETYPFKKKKKKHRYLSTAMDKNDHICILQNSLKLGTIHSVHQQEDKEVNCGARNILQQLNKEPIVDIPNHVADSHRPRVEWKKPDKRVCAVLFHLHKVREQAKLINDTLSNEGIGVWEAGSVPCLICVVMYINM